MTEEELDAIVKERGVMVKAINIRPYMYSLPCQMPGKHFILNEICWRKWSDDGNRITFGLDTHNYLFAKAGEMVEVVPVLKDRYNAEYYQRVFARDAETMNRSRSKGR